MKYTREQSYLYSILYLNEMNEKCLYKRLLCLFEEIEAKTLKFNGS